jgi:hypothetical protein
MSNILKDLVDKSKEIATGYKNLIWKDEEIEKIAEKRGKICESCGELNKAGFYLYCDLCGCYVPAKLRSPESTCAANKWGQEDGRK